MTLLKEEFFVVDSLEKEGGHESKNQEVESQPRKQKIPLPSSQTMTGQTKKKIGLTLLEHLCNCIREAFEAQPIW